MVGGIQKQAEANAQRAIEAMNAALKKPDRDRTVGGRAEAWYRSLRSSVDAGRISVPRSGAFQRNLEVFTVWVGPNAPIDDLTAAKLEEYYGHLSGFVASGRYTPTYTRSLFAAAQQFIAWNSELGLIPPPGNLRSRKFRFRKARPQGLSRADLFTPGEFRTLLAAAGERLRLVLLLMANCGMYQSDVSDLGEDEVDWQARTVTRSRSKPAQALLSVERVTHQCVADSRSLWQQCDEHSTPSGPSTPSSGGMRAGYPAPRWRRHTSACHGFSRIASTTWPYLAGDIGAS